MGNIVKTLRERGLLQDMTDQEMEKYLAENSVSMYIGFDPTSDSLHIGHMVAIMVLKQFQLHGHRPIALIGGGTGLIGDPSGRSSERNLLDAEQLKTNIKGIRKSLGKILEFEGENAATLVNNGDWLGEFKFLDFLRDVGRHFRLGEMLAKDSVRTRLDSESGMSFTEFCYQLLQAYDFRYLLEEYDCVLQCGGSDQWGNITAGKEFIRRTVGKQAFGMTTPLLVDSEGKKMGKSVGGAVWLNEEKLSPYEFYQYWVRQDDRDIERFLKMVTLLPLDEIAKVVAEHAEDPGKRIGQKRLALEVTALIHGAEEARKAKDASEALFGGALAGKQDSEMRAIFNDVPSVQLPRADLDAGLDVLDLLTRTNLSSSKKEARRLVAQNGLYLNNAPEPWPQEERTLGPAQLASESMMVVRAGKKKYCLVQFV